MPILNALAAAFLAGEPSVDQIVERCTVTLGRNWRWVGSLAQRYVEAMGAGVYPRHRDVVEFLRGDKGFRRAVAKYRDELVVARRLVPPPKMRPLGWHVPIIETPGDLADWLALYPGELDWFADLKALGYKNSRPQLRHYYYRVLNK